MKLKMVIFYPLIVCRLVYEYEDIFLDRCSEGIERVAINRPEKRNAFTPRTVEELCDAFSRIRDEKTIGVVLARFWRRISNAFSSCQLRSLDLGL